MRILFLTQYFPPEIGAPQVRLASMIKELVKRGHEVEVVTAMPNHPGGRIYPGYRGSFYRSEVWEGVPLHRVWLYASTGSGWRRMLNYVSFACTSLWGLFRARTPDYIFVESPPLLLSIPAVIASRLWKSPMIFNVADIWPDAGVQLGVLTNRWLIRALERLERWSYDAAQYVTTVNDVFAETLRVNKGVPASKLLFLPNGVDVDLFCPRQADQSLIEQLAVQGKKIFLYAGTHGYAHGIETALAAADIIQAVDDQIEFLFVGDGSEKARLVALARRMALKNVTFLDPMPPADIARLYAISVAALSTLRSSYDTRPVKIFAAMACAKPIAYCGRGEGARLVQCAGAGIVTPPEDAAALADAVLRLAEDRALARELGRSGRQYVVENLSWEKLVHAWLHRLDQP